MEATSAITSLRTRLRAVIGAGALALAVSGCASMAPEAEVPTLVGELPQEFAGPPINRDYAPEAWWTAFGDPVLDQLVLDALASNLDIAEAAGRLEQANAQARIARSALLPALNATASGSATSSPVQGLAFGNLPGFTIDRIDNEVYSLGLGASYELDLFGRARDDSRAAVRDAQASAYDLATVQLSAAAETISAYFDLVDGRRQLVLAEQVTGVLVDRAALTEDRYARGLAESFEVYQIRQELRASEASLPQLKSALASYRARLALLLGTYPEQLDQRLSGPLRPRLVFEPVPAGLPVDLLDQRPDVAAAFARLDAARLRIGARKAERFPRLSLTSSLGTQASSPENVFNIASNWTSALAASVVAPIFDAGRISANIRSARAVYDQRAASYAAAVLGAYAEVDRAIADYDEQRRRYLLLQSQLDEAESSLALQRQRFASGVGSYSGYLDALRAFHQTEANLSSAARATALARLGIHRALGGDWIANGSEPDPANAELIEGDPSSPAN